MPRWRERAQYYAVKGQCFRGYRGEWNSKGSRSRKKRVWAAVYAAKPASEDVDAKGGTAKEDKESEVWYVCVRLAALVIKERNDV
jgi:hypothetical protein